MTINIGLPIEYIQIPNMEICSNKLINSQSLIGIDEFSPFLVGKGESPQIWLYVKDPKGSWQLIVNKNQSQHPQIKVTSSGGITQIFIKDEIIVDSKMINEDSCIISKLDLRPVGLNIFGDNNGLTIGQGRFNGNTFKGAKYVIGLKE